MNRPPGNTCAHPRRSVSRLRFLGTVLGVSALLLALPGPSNARATDRAPLGPSGGVQGTAPSVPVNLSIAPTSFALSPTFWGTTVTPRASLLPDEGDLVNATPARLVVWPGAGAGDDYNPLNNTLVHVVGSSVRWFTPSTSEPEFVQWCRSINCTAIVQVPGEIDNITVAEQVVRYTEQNLSFHPAFWEIGNEPELWKQWKHPWANWNLPTQLGIHRVTPNEYAWELRNYTLALRTVDPSIRILGLAGTGRPQNGLTMTDWINATVGVDASLLAGIAIHVYPASVGPQNLTAFYAQDQGTFSLSSRLTLARSTISNVLNASCPGCGPIPVFVTETGSALAHFDYTNESEGFPGALALAKINLQGLSMNVSTLALFATVMNTSNSWFDLRGESRPDYTLYSALLSHLGQRIYPTTIQVPNRPGFTGSNSTLDNDVNGVATVDPTDANRSDLLLINLNVSTAVVLDPRLPGIASGTPVEAWAWQGETLQGATNNTTWVVAATVAPTATFFPDGLPTNWTLPAQTVAVFEGYPAPATPVTFAESGLAPTTRWFFSVGGVPGESAAPNRTVLLEPGVHRLAVPTLPPGTGGPGASARERLQPFAAASFRVNGTAMTVPIPFDRQWALDLQVAPVGDGSITPHAAWANASAPFRITASASPGDLFDRWTGWGPGSSNSTSMSTVLDPLGPIREVAHFERGYPVKFTESGLPNATNWSVTVHGVLRSAVGPTVRFVEGAGSYGFQVTPVPGYRSIPLNSSFKVHGAALIIYVSFLALTPPPETFPVIWTETGLPIGTVWGVVVRGIPATSNAPTLDLQEANGSYGFTVDPVHGFQARPPAGGFFVNGTTTQVAVNYVPERATFPGIFKEDGLWTNVSWWAYIDGTRVNATGAWIIVQLSNGSHPFSIGAQSGFSPAPREGAVSVSGGMTNVSIAFARPTSPLRLTGLGLPPHVAWQFRLSDDLFLVDTATMEFNEPNGTYSWDAQAPIGYFSTETHGNITLNATPASLALHFLPEGAGPRPAAWPLLRSAGIVGGAIGLVGASTYLLLGALHRAVDRWSPPRRRE
jgi:hypothetical protein